MDSFSMTCTGAAAYVLSLILMGDSLSYCFSWHISVFLREGHKAHINPRMRPRSLYSLTRALLFPLCRTSSFFPSPVHLFQPLIYLQIIYRHDIYSVLSHNDASCLCLDPPQQQRASGRPEDPAVSPGQ